MAFVIDAYSRRILGWRAANTMATPLVLAGDLGPWPQRGHRPDRPDRPVELAQYTSIAFTLRLIEAGVDASVGSVGDAYDNALRRLPNRCSR